MEAICHFSHHASILEKENSPVLKKHKGEIEELSIMSTAVATFSRAEGSRDASSYRDIFFINAEDAGS